MGVYVSEINMPKGEGSKLVLQIFPNGEVYDEHGILLGIANWAEAVPVPPHGRLGDLDKLERDFREDAKGPWNMRAMPMNWADAFEEVADIVADAPTIIEAEDTNKEEE